MAKLPIVSWIGNAATVLVGGWGTVSHQARSAGCSRQTVYDHAGGVLPETGSELVPEGGGGLATNGLCQQCCGERRSCRGRPTTAMNNPG